MLKLIIADLEVLILLEKFLHLRGRSSGISHHHISGILRPENRLFYVGKPFQESPTAVLFLLLGTLGNDQESTACRNRVFNFPGQKSEIAAFVDAVKSGGAMPISAASLMATTEATFGAMRGARDGMTHSVGGDASDSEDTTTAPETAAKS